MNKLGNLIKNKREEKQISQRQIARIINVDNAYISKIENGSVKKPSFEILFKISKELELNFKDLLVKANYSNAEIFELMGIGSRLYNEFFVIEHFNDKELKKYLTFQDELVFIDVLKVLTNYKNNKINEEEVIRLITATEPFEDDKGNLIYITEKGSITIDTPFN